MVAYACGPHNYRCAWSKTRDPEQLTLSVDHAVFREVCYTVVHETSTSADLTPVVSGKFESRFISDLFITVLPAVGIHKMFGTVPDAYHCEL